MRLRTKLIILVSVVMLFVAVLLAPVIVAGRGDSIELASIKGNTARVRILLRFSPSDARFIGFHGYTPLHWAAMGGHTEIVKMLIAKGVDVNALSEEKVSPLFLAAMYGHTDVVKLLLKNGADASINQQCDYIGVTHGNRSCSNSYNGYSALHIAAESGYNNVIKLLLNYGANVNLKDEYQQTPLHLAAANDQASTVKLLLDHGVDVNATTKDKESAVRMTESADVVRLLVDSGADISEVDATQATLLHDAAFRGDVKRVKLLIELGCNPNAVDNNGATPLHHALEHSDCEWCNRNTRDQVVSFLVSHGANVAAKTYIGKRPLDFAYECGRMDLARILAGYGAKPGKQTRNIWTAIKSGSVSEVEAVLRASPNAVNLKSGDEPSPLTAAVLYGNEAIVKMLLDAGADVNAKDSEHSYSPLQMAVVEGSVKLVKLLLGRQTKTTPRSLLAMAVGSGDIQTLKFLVSQSTPIRELPDRGGYLVCQAAEANKMEMLKFLVSQGADIHYKHDLPFVRAMQNGDAKEAADYLLSKGADVEGDDETRAGQTLLHRIAQNPDWADSAEYLLKHGANPNAVDDFPRSVLDVAHDPVTIRAVLKYGGKEGDWKPDGSLSFFGKIKFLWHRIFP